MTVWASLMLLLAGAVLSPALCLSLPLSLPRGLSLPLWSRSSRLSSAAPQQQAEQRAEQADVVVVGAGLCGSTAAFYLHREGFRVVLAEQEEEVGGCVRSRQDGGFLWEEGANSFQPTPQILEVARDMGILDELVLANASLPRYVFWNGKLKKLPSSIKELWRTDLLSGWGKARLLLGLMGVVGPKRAQDDESIEQFASRHFGEEVFTRIVDPFVSGVYAGDPNKLSVAATLSKISALEGPGVTRSILEGAVVKKFQKQENEASFMSQQAQKLEKKSLPEPPPGSLGSFKNGIQSFPLRVQHVLGEKCKLSHSLDSVKPCKGGWLTTFRQGSSGRHKKFFSRAVLLTTPAFTTGKLLDLNLSENEESCAQNMAVMPESSKKIMSINYPPVVGVYLAYPDDALIAPLRGFGHLIPRANNIRSLGTIWCSSLFPGRAPSGYSLLLTFIGGAQDLTIKNTSDRDVVDQVVKDLKSVGLVRSDAPPPRIISIKKWPDGIPQYNMGYGDILDSCRSEMRKVPGMFLGGNYLSGVSVGDCISYGLALSKNVSKFLLDSRFNS